MFRLAQKKSFGKTVDALLRSTIVAAFNFIESYMNGIGVDHCVIKRDNLDKDTACFLTDWDD